MNNFMKPKVIKKQVPNVCEPQTNFHLIDADAAHCHSEIDSHVSLMLLIGEGAEVRTRLCISHFKVTFNK